MTRKKNAINPFSQKIVIKGARGNNLKNIDLEIPKNKLIVVTGVSGSGKSSITMDTLYAEGQRRYVESLSSYARQFLMRMKKPEVDYIKGICPAIAIEQKVSTSNARSTVGTLTEIYDYLRLLYSRVGRTLSPVSGKQVKKHEVRDVIDYIFHLKADTRVFISVAFKELTDRTLLQQLEYYLQKGFSRIYYQEETLKIQDLLEDAKALKKMKVGKINLLVDRLVIQQGDEDLMKRAADSILTCFSESVGYCQIHHDGKTKVFSNRFELDGMTFLEPNQHLFNYNNPYGACSKCEGYGMIMGISEDKVIPNKTLSVYEGAVACWKGEKNGRYLQRFLEKAHLFDFPVHRKFAALTKEEKQTVWAGNEHVDGINDFFAEIEEKSYKIQNRVLMARYRGRTACTSCNGGRLRVDASYVKVGKLNIMEMVEMPLDEFLPFLEKIAFTEYEAQIAKRIIQEISGRLIFMIKVGLGYLTLNRVSSSLSGGETQRINLTRTLGSNLTSSLYVLDEPSVGLHPRDTNRLVEVLKSLRDLGNTVVVVEHEEDIIKNADYLVDMGPHAGIHGGTVVFAGEYSKIATAAKESLTTGYMTGRLQVPLPEKRRAAKSFIELKGASQFNLKNIDVNIPLKALTVVTGVSGSGKTTLVKSILYPALKKHFGENIPMGVGAHDSLGGNLKGITKVEMVGQNAIGRSSRSNPVTYVKAYDAIRNLYSSQQLSKIRGLKPKHFSFNVEGGRCEKCKGEGEIVVEMQFLADVRLVCEDCEGHRFRKEILDVNYKGKNIFEVLCMSIEEGLEFFEDNKEIVQKIKPLNDVGLGYVQLGQSSSTLSGGEAQRIKLASFLTKEKSSEKIFFIFDEPTTGLHFHDVNKLLDALNALVEKGHTVVVVEHNLEVIKSGDWLIDLGPEAGKHGGHLVGEGTPEAIARLKDSHTGFFLKEKLK